MTKKEAETEFKYTILPQIRLEFEWTGMKDIPARSEAWNEYTDYLCKSGRITPRQYSTWRQPRCCR